MIKEEIETMGTLKEEAKTYEPKALTKNIAELESVSTDFQVREGTGTNKETNKDFTYKYVEINGEEYRVPNIVLGDLKAILEEKPDLKSFKVKRTGTGFDTKYTIITLD